MLTKIILTNAFLTTLVLEKASSGASGSCGHFVGNHAILRSFWAKNPVLFTEPGKRKSRRMEDEGFRIQNWGCRAKNWGDALKIWGFDHVTPTFDNRIPVHPLSQIALFWGHFNNYKFSAWGQLTTFSRSATLPTFSISLNILKLKFALNFVTLLLVNNQIRYHQGHFYRDDLRYTESLPSYKKKDYYSAHIWDCWILL